MKSSCLKALCAAACSITLLGLMVVIVDDHDPDFDFYSNSLSAPVQSPSTDVPGHGVPEAESMLTGPATAAPHAPLIAAECMPTGTGKCAN